MYSNSLETPEYATFKLGRGIKYEESSFLVLINATKMDGFIIRITSKEKIVEPIMFSIRADYYDAQGKLVHRVQFTNLRYIGVEECCLKENDHNTFICKSIKFVYEQTKEEETKDFLIAVENFDDDYEKRLYYLMHNDSGSPDYVDEY